MELNTDYRAAEEATAARNRRRVITIVTLLAGVGLIAVLYLLAPRPGPEPVSAPDPIPASVVVAAPQTLTVTVETQGTVAPKREIELVAEVGGRVVEVAEDYANGAFFQAGEALVQIDPQDYRLALVRAEAAVAEAARELALEKGRARQAQREWRDLGNEAANELFLRKPQLAAAEARLDAAEADRDAAQLDLERTAISAPFAGRIRETHVDLGQYVSPGTQIARVYSTDVVEVRLPLTDRQVGLIGLPLAYSDRDADGSAPMVMLQGVLGGERHQWQGRIVRTEASIDVDSRVTYAIAEVAEPFAASEEHPPLVVGLFVQAQIAGRSFDNAVALPRAALYQGDKVFTLDADNRLQLTPVQVLQSDPRQLLVRGLERGQRVVVSQIPYAAPGMAIDPEPLAASTES